MNEFDLIIMLHNDCCTNEEFMNMLKHFTTVIYTIEDFRRWYELKDTRKSDPSYDYDRPPFRVGQVW